MLRWPAHTLRIPKNSNSDVLPALLPRLPSAECRIPIFGMTLPGRPPRRLFRRWVAPSGFLPPNAGILFGDDSPGPAHSRGRGRIILHTGGAWRIPPGAYPSNHKSSVTTPGRVATYYEGLRSTTKYESTTKNYKVLRSTTKYYKVLRSTTKYYEVLQSTTKYKKVMERLQSTTK